MRHRAPRPVAAFWRRIPRNAARLIGQGAGLGPVRALAAVAVIVCLGGAAYAVLAPGPDGSTTGEAGSVGIDPGPGPTTSPDDDVPAAPVETPASDDRTPSDSSPEADPPAADQSGTPSPTTVESRSATPDRASSSPTPGPETPSSSPPEPTVSASAAREDSTPPDTSLSAEFPADDAAVFSFTASEAGSFTCSLDGAAFTACDSATSYSDLHPGWHTFAVRAIDEAGNVDPSAAEHRWHTRQDGSGEEE